ALILCSAVRLALEGIELPGSEEASGAGLEAVRRGAPPAMDTLEVLEEESLEEPVLHKLGEIREGLEASWLHCEFLSLAAWPEHLTESWRSLRPVVRSGEFAQRCDALRELSRAAAHGLP